MIHPEPRTYSVGMLLNTGALPGVPTGSGREVRKRVQVQARSPQGARDAARRAHPGWRPYNPRAI
jgi:hypothetical protein